ncbi:hypothetical protein K438DRAFT_1977629 [Mycena galopus ATCC 62051]|nr:hypothetical protein K438DRAFT_1977629 [Mycena galopus ATCC 62051]
MLWLPLARKTRSGAEFSAFSLPKDFAAMPQQVTALQERDLDVAPLLANAVACESEDQEDHEQDDDVGDFPPPDPWDDIDDVDPSPPPLTSAINKRARTPPTFAQVVASSKKPRTGPHRRHAPGPSLKGHAAQRVKSTDAAHSRRAKKRANKKLEIGHVPTAATARAHIVPATPLPTDLTASTLPAALGAYAAKVADATEKRGSKVPRSLANLLGLGFQLVQWDGITPRPLLDRHGRIIAVLAGRPAGEDYRAAAAAAFCAIRDAGAEARFPASMRKHRRGLFAAINVGLSYGKGQKFPSWLHNKEYDTLADGLIANSYINRLAGFADSAFTLWAPRLYADYRAHDVALREHHPHLRRPFEHSVFFCAAFNFGPNAWTFRHRDVLNLAFGGGHLVLWDLKLVVEFPAGALILLPSATIAHSNVPVQAGEERASFTQFSAGGIFRYIDNGFRTVEGLQEEDPEGYGQMQTRDAKPRNCACAGEHREAMANSDYHTRRKYRAKVAEHSENYRCRKQEEERIEKRSAVAVRRRARKFEAEDLRASHKLAATSLLTPPPKTSHKLALPRASSFQGMTSPKRRGTSDDGDAEESDSSQESDRPRRQLDKPFFAGLIALRTETPRCGLTTREVIFFQTAKNVGGLTVRGVHVYASIQQFSWSTGDIFVENAGYLHLRNMLLASP